VLCSDRQITSPSGHKYEQIKLFSSQANDYRLIFSYAGIPDEATVIFHRIVKSLPEIIKNADILSYVDSSKAVLEKAYSCKHSKGLQTLLGVRIKHFPTFLLRTQGDTIVEGFRGELIGWGDASALRYLRGFILPDSSLDVSEAQVLASYMVSVANRYVDGCSGGPDSKTINADGSITEGSGGIFPNEKERFAHCEEEIGRGLRELLFSGGTKTVATKPLSLPKKQP
jgi:hypothetical protein